MDRQAFVYILRFSDDSYYVGSHRGIDVQARVSEHDAGADRSAYTFLRRSVTLLWCEWFSRFDDAVAFERRIKGWSRKKKEAFVRGDFKALAAHAKRPTARNKNEPSS